MVEGAGREVGLGEAEVVLVLRHRPHLRVRLPRNTSLHQATPKLMNSLAKATSVKGLLALSGNA